MAGPKAAKLKQAVGRLVIGRNSAHEVIRHLAEHIERILVAERHDDRLAEIIEECKSKGLQIHFHPKDSLTDLAQVDSHQGIVIEMKQRAPTQLNDLVESARENSEMLIVALDGVQDPQNLGAILRAAECFSADAVLFSRNRTSEITPVASKASVGASELVTTVPVGNLAEALERLKEAGFWTVVADSGEGAKDLAGFEFPKKCILVLGSEGHGVQSLLQKRADFTVRIAMSGRISSLNVSQAAAIILQAFRGQNLTPAAL